MKLIAFAAAALLAACALPAQADTTQAQTVKPYFTIATSLSVATDGMTKGISETDGNGQVLGNITVSHGAFFAGLNLKNVSTPEGGDDQQQWFAGVKHKAGDYTLSARVWLKTTDNTRPGTDHQFVEYQADVSRTFGKTTAKLLYIYSPDFYGATKQADYVEFSLARQINAKWNISGALGSRTATPKKNYVAWSSGATYAMTPKTSFDLRYYDTSEHAFGKKYEGRVVAMVTHKF